MQSALKTTEVRSRIESRDKEAAEAVLADCGLDMSTAIRLFLRQVVVHRGLPFEVKVPNAATIAAMKEARQLPHARFASTTALFDELEDQAVDAETRGGPSKR